MRLSRFLLPCLVSAATVTGCAGARTTPQTGATTTAATTAATPSSARPTSSTPQSDTARGFTVYHSGSDTDVRTTPRGGAYLAGGGTDIEAGMRWLLAQGGERPGGGFGDVVILRSSGGNGYHAMLTGMGVNSVRSFVIFSRAGADRPEIAEAIRRAEVVFIAGGDQSTYERRWRGTAVQREVNARIAAGYPVGGTSAGLAVLGEHVYSALNVSSTSKDVLASPYDSSVTLSRSLFTLPVLHDVITDSHFAVRDRMGRLLVFLARLQQDGASASPRALAVDEKSAVGVDASGKATVFGSGKGAYLISVPATATRICSANTPLTLAPINVQHVSANGIFDLGQWSAPNARQYTLQVQRGVVTASDGAIY
ncbi:cyanophycinase [Gemmatimonas aurantiaca]|uniref:cyanophycinase n=1 Tax=Gemmatimonas aurantiaca TaxID=173480 RepID=UPI00301DD10C